MLSTTRLCTAFSKPGLRRISTQSQAALSRGGIIGFNAQGAIFPTSIGFSQGTIQQNCYALPSYINRRSLQLTTRPYNFNHVRLHSTTHSLPDAHVVRELREMARVQKSLIRDAPDKPDGLKSALSAGINQGRRLKQLQHYILPQDQWRFFAKLEWLRKSNAILSQILDADRKSGRNKWSEEERQLCSQMLAADRRNIWGYTCFIYGMVAFVGYKVMKYLGLISHESIEA